MSVEHFPDYVAEKLAWYVYRLVDPTDDKTFYIGKGQGDRVFQHARGAVREFDVTDNELMDLKTEIIKRIISDGHAVKHVIHRHGMKEDTAYEVEAALIELIKTLQISKVDIGAMSFGQ